MKSQKGIAVVLGDSPAQKAHLLGVTTVRHHQQTHDMFTAGREGCVLRWSSNAVSEVKETAEAGDRILSLWPRTLPLDFDYTDAYFMQLEEATLTLDPYPPQRVDHAVVQKYSIHSDWINDLRIMNRNELLVSASLDLSIKMTPINTDGPFTSTTLGVHDDYVKALATPFDSLTGSSTIVSGGLDKQVAIWDIVKLVKVQSFKNPHPRGSIYALAAQSSMIASGGPDNVITLIDSRLACTGTANQSLGLKKFTGHQDTVKDLVLTDKYILSASSDSSIKLWCLRTNKLVKNFEFHNAPVWSLHVNAGDIVEGNIERFYSGDKLGNVVMSDMGYYNHPSLFAASNDGGDFDFSPVNELLGVHTTLSHNSTCNGILAIDTLGDGTVWTATNNSLDHYHTPHTEALQNYQLARCIESVKTGGDALAAVAGNDLASLLSSDDEDQYYYYLNRAKSVRSMALIQGTGVLGAVLMTTLDQQLDRNDERSLNSGVRYHFDSNGANDAVGAVISEHETGVQGENEGGNPRAEEEGEGDDDEEFETIFLSLVGGASNDFITFPIATTELEREPERGLGWGLADGVTDSQAPVYAFEVDILREALPTPVLIFRAYNNRPLESFSTLSDNALLKASMLNNRRVVMCLSNKGQVFWWDLFTLKRTKAALLQVDTNAYANDDQHRHSLLIEKFDQLVQENQPAESVPQWCKVETKGGKMVLSFDQGQYLDAEIYWDEFSRNYPGSDFGKMVPQNGDERMSIGKIIVASLLKPYVDQERALDEKMRLGELMELKKDPRNVVQSKPQATTIVETPPVPAPEKVEKKFKLFGRKKSPVVPVLMPPVPAPVTGVAPVLSLAEDLNGTRGLSGKSTEAYVETMGPALETDDVETLLAEIREHYMKDLVSLSHSALVEASVPTMLGLPSTTKIIVQKHIAGLGGAVDVCSFTVGDLETRLKEPAVLQSIRRGLPRWVGEGFLKNTFPEREQLKIGFVIREKTEPGVKKGEGLPGIDHMNVKLNATHSLRVRKLLSHITDRFESQTQEMKNNQPPEEWLEIHCNGKVLPLDMTLMTVKMTIWRSGGDMVLYYKRTQPV